MPLTFRNHEHERGCKHCNYKALCDAAREHFSNVAIQAIDHALDEEIISTGIDIFWNIDVRIGLNVCMKGKQNKVKAHV